MNHETEVFHVFKVASMTTLCGVTGDRHRDTYLNEARDIVYAGKQFPGFVRCEACFGRLLDLDFKRAETVED